jgi:hypothetical protein
MGLPQTAHDAGENTEAEYFTMRAAAARTKGDAVYMTMDAQGYLDLTIASNAAVHRIAVAAQNIASGDRGLYCVRGPCTLTVPSATYTEGNGLQVTTGAIAAGSGFPAAGVAGQAQVVFGVVSTAASGTITSITATLHGDPFTSA